MPLKVKCCPKDKHDNGNNPSEYQDKHTETGQKTVPGNVVRDIGVYAIDDGLYLWKQVNCSQKRQSTNKERDHDASRLVNHSIGHFISPPYRHITIRLFKRVIDAIATDALCPLPSLQSILIYKRVTSFTIDSETIPGDVEEIEVMVNQSKINKAWNALDKCIAEWRDKYRDKDSEHYDPYAERCRIKLEDLALKLEVTTKTLREWSIYRRFERKLDSARYKPYKGLIIDVDAFIEERKEMKGIKEDNNDE